MKPLCVSFVEQDHHLAEQVLAHLSSTGMQGIHCKHPDELNQQNVQGTCDVVILDAVTLGEQSLTLASQLAKHPELRVIMVAPASQPEERIAAIAAGADVCISKPFNTIELMVTPRMSSMSPRVAGWR